MMASLPLVLVLVLGTLLLQAMAASGDLVTTPSTTRPANSRSHEDSNATDFHNGTSPAKSHRKKGILSSPAKLGAMVASAVIGGVGLAVAVVFGIWQFQRWRRRRNLASDQSELIDGTVYYSTNPQGDLDVLPIGEHSLQRVSRNGDAESVNATREENPSFFI